uniref:Disease resistance protein n=1 Tax=Solanum tuberosum TaxID=4113 RepID=M1BB37_SOLTU
MCLNKTDEGLITLQQLLILEFAFHFSAAFFFSRRTASISKQLVIPQDANLRSLLLAEFYSFKVGGHADVSRTFHRLFSNFHWTGMCADVQKFVLECQTYQQMKDSTLKPTGLLSPIAHSKCYF